MKTPCSPRPDPLRPRRLQHPRRAVLALALPGLGLLGTARAQAFDLKAVTALLARQKSGQARFSEERTVAGLSEPLRASGLLSFVAPDRFTRTVTDPRPESMEVQGNVLVLRRAGRTRQMTVDAIPELAALIEAVRGTLTGNAVLLERFFKAAVDGSAPRWTLSLVPRDAQLATQVREIRIAGSQGEMRSVELWMAGGDRSLMLIEPLQPLAGAAPPAQPAPPR
jgi:hypothetical protein